MNFGKGDVRRGKDDQQLTSNGVHADRGEKPGTRPEVGKEHGQLMRVVARPSVCQVGEDGRVESWRATQTEPTQMARG